MGKCITTMRITKTRNRDLSMPCDGKAPQNTEEKRPC
jgi:hypothetical protein